MEVTVDGQTGDPEAGESREEGGGLEPDIGQVKAKVQLTCACVIVAG